MGALLDRPFVMELFLMPLFFYVTCVYVALVPRVVPQSGAPVAPQVRYTLAVSSLLSAPYGLALHLAKSQRGACYRGKCCLSKLCAYLKK